MDGMTAFRVHTYSPFSVPQFLLPVLPNYSECCASTPPPPFEVALSSALPPVQTCLEQVGGTNAVALEESQTSESSRTFTQQELFPTTPPPDYETVNIVGEVHTNSPARTECRQSIN
ncbi:hypothetical protein PHET_01452 [Paragonimus heterotremus]|uniref:Uncharacterized protein n=1 Tax=Paragonimus heterotremus TaxID=100268 RepID=A0A8J4STH4_9TREM|nr:hypothetical protein PHET_01452 [Paragonimus heterotremus]